jgi:protein tyrosine phosphatase (PTP) superfamily phosphohydrolase (DUF442 family)
MICPAPAKLSNAQIEEITSLEKKLGLILVAYEHVPKIARLTSEEIENVKKIERETGKIMLAYEA